MCGLAGILDLAGNRPMARERIERMAEAVRHRGPDGSGFHLEAGLALGHRRLAIIDRAGGAQPMAGADERFRVVYNGEIYNFRELRRELQGLGHRFATRSDTEVLLAAFAQWGSRCLARLRGMFAFALWDGRTRRLFLARDRLGEKPLYHATTPDGLFLFGSEIGAVLAGVAEIPPLDLEALADYLTYGYVPDPKSIYRDIRKLPPGHFLEVAGGLGSAQAAPVRYWRPTFDAPAHRGQYDDLAAELTARLGDAVTSRMIADVPLGAFLSGGVDSSGVVALMARAGTGPVTTCAVGFDDPAVDESAHARRLAERYGTTHHEERVAVDAPLALVDRLAAIYGEPFADSSALPTWIVSGLARRHVTVALTGDGGDEVFAGYRRYPLLVRQEMVRQRIPLGMRQLLFGPLARVYPKLDWAPRALRGKATFEALSTDATGAHLRSVTALPRGDRDRLLAPDFLRALGGYEPISVLARHAAEAGAVDPLARAQYVDLMTWLPGRMLVKVDRASMAHGLELRPPFLDHELVDWATRLPADLKLQGMSGKRLLKRALEPLVPHELLYRPKQGFTLPLARWLRGNLRPRIEALGTRGAIADAGLFSPSGLRRVIAEHGDGRRDHTPILWAMLMLDAFLRAQRPALAPPRQTVAA